MKRALLIILVGLTGRAAMCADETNAAPAQTTVSPTGFEAFKVISSRNIFDPTRRAPNPKGETPVAEARPKRVDTLTLLGAIAYEKGEYAFFDGSRSEYRKSVTKGESIAGYKVADVTGKQVTLENEGKTVDLPVGFQMKKPEDGEWQLAGRAEVSAESSSSSSSSSSSTSSRSEGERTRFDSGDRFQGGRSPDRGSFERRPRNDGERSSRTERPSSSPISSPAPSTSGSSSGGDTSEVLKRLLEQRNRGN